MYHYGIEEEQKVGFKETESIRSRTVYEGFRHGFELHEEVIYMIYKWKWDSWGLWL